MSYNIDLHIHSKFAYATSKNLTLENLLIQKRILGIDLIGTGDILHNEWFEVLCKYEHLMYKELIPSVEISVSNLHYLIILPNLQARNKLYNSLKPFSKNIDSNGRPSINLQLKGIITICKTLDCLFGLAHAFSPYTGYFAKHKILELDLDFIELGLDANKKDCLDITQIKAIPFIKASDCHSLKSLGREYIVSEIEITNIHVLKLMLTNNLFYIVSSIPHINKWYSDFVRGLKQRQGVHSIILSLQTECNTELDNSVYRLPLPEVLAHYYNIKNNQKIQDKLEQVLINTTLHKILENYKAYEFGKYFFEENINIITKGGGNENGKISLKY